MYHIKYNIYQKELLCVHFVLRYLQDLLHQLVALLYRALATIEV